MRIPAMDSRLGQPNEAFEPWITRFWVGSSELGLGFSKNPNGGEERKEKERRKWKDPGCLPFYMYTGSGWPKTRPTSSFWPLDLDPDGSGSIQRSWSVSLIRIHQIRGFWACYPWAKGFFQILWVSLLITPLFLLPEPLYMLRLLAKFVKNS